MPPRALPASRQRRIRRLLSRGFRIPLSVHFWPLVWALASLPFLLLAPPARGDSLEPLSSPEGVSGGNISKGGISGDHSDGDALGFDSNIFPILVYSPETRLGLGAGIWIISRKEEQESPGKPDNLWINVTHTQERQTIAQFIPELYFREDALRVRLHLRYLDFPTRFFGIGNDTPENPGESYTPLTREARLWVTHRIQGALGLGVAARIDNTDIVETQPGGELRAGGVPGSEGSKIVGAGLTLFRDTREHHFSPREGSLQEFTVLRFGRRTGSDFSFTDSAADLRWYFPLAKGHVLAFQGLLQSIAGEAPFTSLPRLGGKFLFRGLFEGRFRDKNLIALQTEYRFPINGRVTAVAFGAYGDVAGSPGEFRLAEFKKAVGAGLRYAWNVRERINVRLDAAAAEDSTGIYFSVGEAF